MNQPQSGEDAHELVGYPAGRSAVKAAAAFVAGVCTLGGLRSMKNRFRRPKDSPKLARGQRFTAFMLHSGYRIPAATPSGTAAAISASSVAENSTAKDATFSSR